MPVHVGIFLIASAINVLAWLKEEQDVPSARFSHLPLWYFRDIFLAVLTVWLVMTTLKNNWLGSYLPLDYTNSRVLNMSFYTQLMDTPFFLGAIPTYGVLPYSMISTTIYSVYVTDSESGIIFPCSIGEFRMRLYWRHFHTL